MLHPILFNKLDPAIQAAIKNQTVNTPDALKRYLRGQINILRNKYKSGGIDILQGKLEDYGNKGCWSRQKISQLSEMLYRDKRVDDTIPMGEAISVEIECFFVNSSHEDQFVKAIRKAGIGKHVTIKDDGSLHWGDPENPCCTNEDGETIEDCGCVKPYGREIVVTFTRSTMDILKQVCVELNIVKAKVNKTCGLHVHFDCRHLTKRQVSTIANRIGRCVPALKMMLPKSRRNNRFCESDVNNFRRGQRYSFVNVLAYNRHMTLEIRGHSGTTDAFKMLQWIDILTCIMKTRNTKPIDTIDLLLFAFKFSDNLKVYIRQRYLKFNPAVNNQQQMVVNEPEGFDDIAEDNGQIQETA